MNRRFSTVLVALFAVRSVDASLTIEIRAVSVNEARIPPSSHVTVVPGDIVGAEILVSGWSPDATDGEELRGIQVHFDAMRWFGEGTGAVWPAFHDRPPEGLPCSLVPACEDVSGCIPHGTPPAQVCVGTTCTTTSDCGSFWPLCEPTFGSSLCVGPFDRPSPQGVTFDTSRPDYLFFGRSSEQRVDNTTFSTRYAGFVVLPSDAAVDTGKAKFFAAIPLRVSDAGTAFGEAFGAFRIAPSLLLNGNPVTFGVYANGTSVLPVESGLIPLEIDVVQPTPEPESIPAVSEWGMAAMLLALLVISRMRNLSANA